MQIALPRTNSFPYAILLFVIAIVIPLRIFADTSPARPDEKAVRQRVDALLKQMTLEEKIGQLTQLFDFPQSKNAFDDEVSKGEVGSLLFVTDPAEINRLQHLAVEKTRLHIPLIFGFDVIHGFRTIFPVPIAMAAEIGLRIATRGSIRLRLIITASMASGIPCPLILGEPYFAMKPTMIPPITGIRITDGPI